MTVRKIRQAIEQDIPVLVEFQCRMAVETENLVLDVPTVTAGASELVRDPSKGKYWVALDGTNIVGCLMTTYEWSDWRNGTVLWIQSVYVDERYRGTGVYKAMFEFIKEQVAIDSSLKGIRLYVDTGNVSARNVYKALGMNGEHYSVFEWMKA